MQGRCACSAVTLVLAHRPEFLNQCDCSVCLRVGAAWGYFHPRDVTITGETTAFARADMGEPTIAFHFCPTCGSTINWGAAGRRPGRAHRDQYASVRARRSRSARSALCRRAAARRPASPARAASADCRGRALAYLTRKASFAPVVAPNTQVLVLGSLPGEKSLAAGQYYAHPRNRFWHLIGGVIGVDLASLAYAARLDALLRAGVGLWDALASAQREGSLDAAIRDPEHNALADLAASLPALRAVGFNGATATRIGTRLLGHTGLALVPLPSSSPAFAAMPLAQKTQLWAQLRAFLA